MDIRRVSRSVGLLAVGVLLAAGCTAPPASWQDEMLQSVNAQRAAAGAPPVQLCGRLGSAAQAHSQDQAATATMSHTGSDGSTMTARANRAGYVGWTALAENVAAGQPNVSSVMHSWMNSTSGHRTNILNGSYTHLGVGQATRAGTSSIYWTQMFGRSGSC